MSDPPSIPAPQYTLTEALSVCLAMCHRAMAEVRALSRVPGPAGEVGPEGKRGLQGERGEKGERGESGSKGTAGDAGKDGERGQKGEPGRNAADLTLLQEYIDQRVERMVQGASVTTPDGGRTMHWSLGGKVHQVKTSLVLDAGVWKEAQYNAGDGVTSGGSFWIAQTETAAKPGKSDDWRLAVKRGTDGRDYRPEEKRTPEPVRFK